MNTVMDNSDNSASKVIIGSTFGPSNELSSIDVKCKDIIPKTNINSSKPGESKRLIRTITPIDSKKLQQLGLDRKIAEALSHRKSLKGQQTKATKESQTRESIGITVAASIERTDIEKTSSLTKSLDCMESDVKSLNEFSVTNITAPITNENFTSKSTIPPKITVTGPDTSSKFEEKQLQNLSAQHRLENVKQLLNKKLMKKHTTQASPIAASDYVMSGGKASSAHLKNPLAYEQSPKSSEAKSPPLKTVETSSVKLSNADKESSRVVNFLLKNNFNKSSVRPQTHSPSFEMFVKSQQHSKQAPIPKASIKSIHQQHNQTVSSSSTNIPNEQTASKSENKSCVDSVTSSSCNAVPKSLIVLENKVLSQHEMIDLTSLGLSTSKVVGEGFSQPHKPIPEVVIKQEQPDDFPPLPPKVSNHSNIHPLSTKTNGKIVNAKKLKSSPEKLVDETTQTLNKSLEKSLTKEQSAMPNSLNANNETSQVAIIKSSPTNCSEKIVSKSEKQLPIKPVSKFASTPKETNIALSLMKSETGKLVPSTKSSSVEIVNEPKINDTFSAVDFIASLTNMSHSMTEKSSMELSQEELNLNASCSSNLISLAHKTSGAHKAATESAKPSLQIGKIVTIPKENILKLSSSNLNAIVIASCNGPETIVTKSSEVTMPSVTTDNQKLQSMPIKILNKSANLRKSSAKSATLNRVKKTVFKSENSQLHKQMLECLNIEVKEIRETSRHETESGNDKSSQFIEFSKNVEANSVNQELNKTLSKEKVETELLEPKIHLIQENNQENLSETKKLNVMGQLSEQNDVKESPEMMYKQTVASNKEALKSSESFKTSKTTLIPEVKPCVIAPKSEKHVMETKDITSRGDNDIHQQSEITKNTGDFTSQTKDEEQPQVNKSAPLEKYSLEELNANQVNQIPTRIAPTVLEVNGREKPRLSCKLNQANEPLEDVAKESTVEFKFKTDLDLKKVSGESKLEVEGNEKEKIVSEISKLGLYSEAKTSHVSSPKQSIINETLTSLPEGVNSSAAKPDEITNASITISNCKLNSKRPKQTKQKSDNSPSSNIKSVKTCQKNKEKICISSIALSLTKLPLKRKRRDLETSANEPKTIGGIMHPGKKSNQLKLGQCINPEENGEERKKDDEEDSLLEPMRIEEFKEYNRKEENFLDSDEHSDRNNKRMTRKSKLRKNGSVEDVTEIKKEKEMSPLRTKIREKRKKRIDLGKKEKKPENADATVKSEEQSSNTRRSQRKTMLEFKKDKSASSMLQPDAKKSINYEDLEFLPVNAEIQDFKPLRAKRKLLTKNHEQVSKESLNDSQEKDHQTDNSEQKAMITSPQSELHKKTLETLTETHKFLTDSDSEYEGVAISFDDSPEFLGFEDSFEVGLELKEDDNKLKNVERKQTTLKDWLATGKAITSIALKEEKPCSSRSIPLKKRWDLNMGCRDEIAVTHDTLSVDEEEVKVKKRKLEHLVLSESEKSEFKKNKNEKLGENGTLRTPLHGKGREAKASSKTDNVKHIPLRKFESPNLKVQDSTNNSPVYVSHSPVEDCLRKMSTSKISVEGEAKSKEKKIDEKKEISRLKSEAKTTSEVLENDPQFSKTIATISHSVESPVSMSTKSETSSSSTITSSSVKRGRGRKSASLPNLENNFNPRLLLATKRSQIDSEEILTCSIETTGSGPIQCGLCLKRTSSQKWLIHLSEHYGFGFKLGEKELNACNRSIVLNQIISYFKETNIKGLCCRMCQKMYRSGLGLLTHIETCGVVQERVICEYCKRDYSKLSLTPHLRTCAQRLRLESPNVEEKEKPNSTLEETFSNTGRLKRVSTIKAESKLKMIGEELGRSGNKEKNSEFDAKTHVRYHPPMDKNYIQKCSQDLNKFGKAFCPKKICRFNSNTLAQLEEHINKCKHITKPGYYCCFCKIRCFETETLAIEHVEQCHKPKVEESENSDCNVDTNDENSSDDDNSISDAEDAEENEDNLEQNSTKKSARKKSKMKPAKINSDRNRVFAPRSQDISSVVIKKWRNFLEINYSLTPLFSKFSCKFRLGHFSELSNYLPRQKASMKFSILKDMKLHNSIGQPEKDMEWSELKRFESVENEFDLFFFLGAPVKIVAWVPLPHNVNEQYLAVVYRKDMFKYTRFSEPKRHNTLLLLFKVSHIASKTVSQLQLHYGVNIADGPIHHISFLPSGGYNAEDNRLALVAVGGIASTIKIYALPLKVAINVDETEPIIVEIEPSFLLKCGLNDEDHVMYKTQCLQICWSEASGHNHIFAAYSNGCIGIWDISDDMQCNLNCFLIDNINHYVPLNYWYVGEKGIKHINVHYDTNGPRWLAVSGMLRRFTVFDIQNIMQPIIMRDELNKNIVRCMDWSPVWETIILAICDSMPTNGRCATIVNPLSLMFAHNKLDIMSSAVTQVHYTPLTNLCVCSTDNGDLLFLSPRELHYEQPLGKQFGEPRRFLSTMDVKTLNDEPLFKIDKSSTSELPNDWNMYDKNYKYKYGLVFGSIFPLKAAHKNTYLSENRRPPLHIAPLMRINSLRCNLNSNGKRLTAVGYENGFVRIINFKKDSQLL
uniref:Uncharacterized protein n=1 Tax=Glossina brevipalpis TaxID=37001 RepID=A0A1A9WQ27_9MUSC